jgi:hypothetical protein
MGCSDPVTAPESCPACGSDRVLTGGVGDRHARTCCQCGHRWKAIR